VHEARESANHSLVGFYRAVPAEFLKTSALHGKPNPVHHKPCGFLGNTDGAMYFPRANAVLTVGDHPDGRKPFVQSKRRVFKDSPYFNAELTFRVASLALPDVPLRDETDLIGAAGRTNSTVRPAPFSQVIQAVIRIGEIDNCVFQCAWLAHIPNHRGFGLMSQVYSCPN
jgi:hypothetical protein